MKRTLHPLPCFIILAHQQPNTLFQCSSFCQKEGFSSSSATTLRSMAQKVVLRVPTMTDDKTKQKAIEAVADIYGIDSIAADVKDNKMTVIGDMDTVAIAKKLKKLGKIDIVSVGPAKEEKKAPEKKDEKKEDKKDDKKDDKKASK